MISASACISLHGLLDVKTVRGASNGDTFYDFVQENLLPHLMPFDGINPHSVVEGIGILVHFLPPYSPDFNPNEEAFSKVKSDLQSQLLENNGTTDVETQLLTSFISISPQDCHGWIVHPGINNLD